MNISQSETITLTTANNMNEEQMEENFFSGKKNFEN